MTTSTTDTTATAKLCLNPVVTTSAKNDADGAETGISQAGGARKRVSFAEAKNHARVAEALETARRAEPLDDPTLDGTDFAHPAWWRGADYAGVEVAKRTLALVGADTPGAVVEYLQQVLNHKQKNGAGGSKV